MGCHAFLRRLDRGANYCSAKQCDKFPRFFFFKVVMRSHLTSWCLRAGQEKCPLFTCDVADDVQTRPDQACF